MVSGERQRAPWRQIFQKQHQADKAESGTKQAQALAWHGTRLKKQHHFDARVQTRNRVNYYGTGKEVAQQSDAWSTFSVTTEATDSEPTSPMTPTLFGQRVEIAHQATWSVGSKFHHTGDCRPCAWYWKVHGCLNAKACGYCHLCPSDEVKNRKRAKLATMRQRLARENEQAQVAELPKLEERPQIDPIKWGEGKAHEEQAHREQTREDQTQENQKILESPENFTPEDQTGAAKQQRLLVKNTFIHVEFPDIPEASRIPIKECLVATAGILFGACQWK